jgi:hypothetical protein
MAEGTQKMIAWDWGWGDAWAEAAIRRLPREVAHMSVSEWSIPIKRGGVDSVVGEYSLSVIGPGPRATKHWAAAKARPMPIRTLAKIQANNSWECAAVPYIPALANVAQHVAKLREQEVNGIMLGWTLGGYPSPNLEIAGKLIADKALTPEMAMRDVAAGRYGDANADAVVAAWKRCSEGFSEYPFHGTNVYTGPQHTGPSNPLWGEPTGYNATMVCFPYDGLEAWRSVYPVDVYIQQMRKVAEGFEDGAKQLLALVEATPEAHKAAMQQEADMMAVCGIQFRSCANQALFVQLRNGLADAGEKAGASLDEIESILKGEIALAKSLHAIQRRESTIGYEASNHYFFVPVDLAEKVINCEDLLQRWLPEKRVALAK